MGFPTLDCRGPASEVARKQSPRLLREVSSLSRSWKRGSAPEMKMKHRREGLKAGTPLGAEKRTSIQHSGVGCRGWGGRYTEMEAGTESPSTGL